MKIGPKNFFLRNSFLGDFLVPARQKTGKLVGNRPSGSLSRSETKIYWTEFRAASTSSQHNSAKNQAKNSCFRTFFLHSRTSLVFVKIGHNAKIGRCVCSVKKLQIYSVLYVPLRTIHVSPRRRDRLPRNRPHGTPRWWPFTKKKNGLLQSEYQGNIMEEVDIFTRFEVL